MRFHIPLYKEVIRQVIAQYELCIKPSIWMSSLSRITQVIRIEYALCYTSRSGIFSTLGIGEVFRLVFLSTYFECFHSIEQVHTEMETTGKFSHYELGLYTHAQSPAIGSVSSRCSHIGLAELRFTRHITIVVEHVHSTAKSEHVMCTPISSSLQCKAKECLSILVRLVVQLQSKPIPVPNSSCVRQDSLSSTVAVPH